MSSIGELFGFPGEQNDAPFDGATLDTELDRILATRPIAGAPDGYVSPAQRPQAPQGDGVGAAGGTQVPAAPVAPEAPAGPPPFGWPAGPASAYPPAAATPPAPPAPPQAPPAVPAPPAPAGPPAAPAGTPDPFAGMSDLERYEAALVVQALRDPERAAGVRRAYIGAPEPIGGVPAQPPPAAPPFAIGTPPPPAAPAAGRPAEPLPLPEGVDEGSPEATIIRTQQEQARQLEEIRAGVAARDQQTEHDQTVAAASSAVAAFTARYGDRLTQPEIDWLCQMAGYQKLPDAFRNSNPALTREAAFTQALEFQLRSTDSLFTKIVAGPPGAPATAPPGAPPATPPAATPPVVHPGQTPVADARHRYLTALSSAASPTGEAPTHTPLAHRPDGKLDERSRMELVKQMTAGGTMGELMGPN